MVKSPFALDVNNIFSEHCCILNLCKKRKNTSNKIRLRFKALKVETFVESRNTLLLRLVSSIILPIYVFMCLHKRNRNASKTGDNQFLTFMLTSTYLIFILVGGCISPYIVAFFCTLYVVTSVVMLVSSIFEEYKKRKALHHLFNILELELEDKIYYKEQSEEEKHIKEANIIQDKKAEFIVENYYHFS